MPQTPDGLELVPCDTCGELYTFFELAETIEEYLCERCASGIEEYDEDFHD